MTMRLIVFLAAMAAAAAAEPRPRARDLGITPGIYEPGPLNAITDVAGVRVGHTTLVEGPAVRTGVTAVVPHGGNLFRDKVAAAVFVGNAFGKLAGSTQVQELGTLETPIVLTNTLSVGTAVEALVASDFAPVQGFVLTMAVMYVALNLAIDVIYVLIDPRMRIEA